MWLSNEAIPWTDVILRTLSSILNRPGILMTIFMLAVCIKSLCMLKKAVENSKHFLVDAYLLYNSLYIGIQIYCFAKSIITNFWILFLIFKIITGLMYVSMSSRHLSSFSTLCLQEAFKSPEPIYSKPHLRLMISRFSSK